MDRNFERLFHTVSVTSVTSTVDIDMSRTYQVSNSRHGSIVDEMLEQERIRPYKHMRANFEPRCTFSNTKRTKTANGEMGKEAFHQYLSYISTNGAPMHAS